MQQPLRQRATNQRLSAAEYKDREDKRKVKEAKEAEEWTDAADEDGSAEIILLYFGIATIVFGLLGLTYVRSIYLEYAVDVQPEPQQEEQ